METELIAGIERRRIIRKKICSFCAGRATSVGFLAILLSDNGEGQAQGR